MTWNIRSGGGSRVPQIVESVVRHAPDIVVLTEFRNNPTGAAIRERLKYLGLTHQTASHSAPAVNSVFVAARQRFSETVFPALGVDLHRCILARIDGLSLFALYFAQKKEKLALFEFLVRLPPKYLKGDSLFIGDFNTGRERDGGPFFCADQFQKLEEMGWSDPWRRQYPRKRDYSWYSSAGNGFRIDQVLVSPALLPRIHGVRYSHRERMARVSDHSPLILDIS